VLIPLNAFFAPSVMVIGILVLSRIHCKNWRLSRWHSSRHSSEPISANCHCLVVKSLGKSTSTRAEIACHVSRSIIGRNALDGFLTGWSYLIGLPSLSSRGWSGLKLVQFAIQLRSISMPVYDVPPCSIIEAYVSRYPPRVR
jgi:hypothetical protein